MKKILTLFFILLLLSSVKIFSGDRLVLVERFTSSTCPPCGTNNPIMDAWFNTQDPDKVIGLAYHMNWPAPGNDPMYWFNVTDNNGKRTYYNVNSIPQAYMDGIVNIQPNYSSSAMNTYFNSRTNILSPITLIVTDSTYGDSVLVRARIYCEVSLSNPTVYVNFLIIEKMITNTNPPPTNGESAFPNVMRKTMPTFGGMQVYLSPGQTYNLEQRYKMDPVWQPSQLKNVVFVQGSDKEVLAAGQTTNNFTLIPATSYLSVNQGQNQSANTQVTVPYVFAGYNSNITLTASVEPPTAGVTVSFPNGNIISSFPGGSANVMVSSTSGVPTGNYRIVITGTNTNNKVHKTSVSYLVGQNFTRVGTSSSYTTLQYKVDNISYTAPQLFTWDISSQHTLSAVTPQTFGSIRYVFRSWSDGGAETHTITETPQTTQFTVNYGVQYKLISIISPGAIPASVTGGNIYYDSSSSVNFTITPQQVQYNGQTWWFQRWQGNGNGSYTGTNASPQVTMNNVIVETAVWDTIAPFGITNLGNGVPQVYALHQNYPNPFNPTTKVKFDLPKNSFVRLSLYDVLGSEVAVFLNGDQNAGYYEAEINASSFASGIYFYVLKAGDYVETRKMILVK